MVNGQMRSIVFFLILPAFLLARGKVLYEKSAGEPEPPWLTGPLLAPSGMAVPLGHINVEPYVYVTAYTGIYNGDWEVVKQPTAWVNYFQVPTQVGLTSWMDFQFSPTLYWNYTHHKSSWNLGDMPVALDIQLYVSPPSSWLPSIKLVLKENLPIGRYDNLDPKKKGTDLGGNGAWTTGGGLVFGKLIHFVDVYYLNLRLSVLYNIPAPVHVKGFNFYGGGFGTNARVYPGNNLQVDLGLEVTLAQTWAFALDVLGIWGDGDSYTGEAGVDAFGNIPRIGRGSHVNISLAPAIEYNWNANLGIIAGCWFTVAGRKSPVYQTAVVALNYYL